MYTHAYAHKHTCACMTPSTRWSTATETHNLCTNMHTHTHTHVYKRIHIHIHTHMQIYTYIHVRTHTHIHIYTHIYKMYICTHASTPDTTARQRPCEELTQTQEALHISLFDAIKPHLAPPMLGLHLTHFLRHQYPSTPHPLFPTYPRTVHKNGPLRSCRKIRGKVVVQQSPSRWAHRTSSLRMTKVTVHGETKGQWGTTKPATAHHTISTAQRPDNICSSALVRGRSTQFMASPCRWPQRPSPETRLHFRHFRGSWKCIPTNRRVLWIFWLTDHFWSLVICFEISFIEQDRVSAETQPFCDP